MLCCKLPSLRTAAHAPCYLRGPGAAPRQAAAFAARHTGPARAQPVRAARPVMALPAFTRRPTGAPAHKPVPQPCLCLLLCRAAPTGARPAARRQGRRCPAVFPAAARGSVSVRPQPFRPEGVVFFSLPHFSAACTPLYRPCSLCIVPATPPARSHSSIFSFHAKAPVQLFLHRGLFVYALFLPGLPKKGRAFLHCPAARKSFPRAGARKSGPPAKQGDFVSPERAYYRQASQEALKKSAACITCPAARKRATFVQDYPSGNRKIVNLFPLRSMLEAKAFLLSPALLGGVISLKHTKREGRPCAVPPQYAFHPARCPQAFSRPFFSRAQALLFLSQALLFPRGPGCHPGPAGPAPCAAAHHVPRRFTGT